MKRKTMQKELILDGDGQATFTLNQNGQMNIELFDQRTIVDTFEYGDRWRLLCWLVRGFLHI